MHSYIGNLKFEIGGTCIIIPILQEHNTTWKSEEVDIALGRCGFGIWGILMFFLPAFSVVGYYTKISNNNSHRRTKIDEIK